MGVMYALHTLVDRLGDDEADEVYSVALKVVPQNSSGAERERHRHGVVASGRAFFSAAPTHLGTLAHEQAVGPIRDFDALRADSWPEDESVDEFVETIRKWRREGG